MDMKRDGRTLDHKTLETIRLMAVERVREGEPAAKVIEAYGFNRTTIYKWLQAAMQPGLGIRALRGHTPVVQRRGSASPSVRRLRSTPVAPSGSAPMKARSVPRCSSN